MNKLTVSMQDISDSESTTTKLKHDWLVQHGWEYTCATETSVWVWQKEIDGKILQVNCEMAMDIENQRNGCPECGSDEIAFENPRTGSGCYTCQDCGYELTKEESLFRKLGGTTDAKAD